jgi:hypothetical protein
MAFDVNEFRNKFIHGGARASQFAMQMVWPDILRGLPGVTGAEADFRFLCHMSEIPESKLGKAVAKYFGRFINYAGDRTFEPLSVTIYNDEDFKVRKALEYWSQAITGHQTTVSQFNGSNISGSYATDGIVTQMSRNSGGAPLQSYKFVGMFPSNLGAIKLDWADVDKLEDFTCEFTYQYWIPVDGATGQPPSANF